MELAIISDTHLPRGGRRLPEACVARLRAADVILHAGDLMRVEILEQLREYGEVHAVAGNVDDAELRAVLPGRLVLELDGVRIGMIHDAGPRAGRVARLRREFPSEQAVIFGHSHLPSHERDPDGFQIFNPGSPTERRRAPTHTMGLARVRAGVVKFELVALD